MKSKINLFTDKSYDDNRKLSLKVSYTSGTLLHDSSISISLLPEQRADSNHYFSALRDNTRYLFTGNFSIMILSTFFAN